MKFALNSDRSKKLLSMALALGVGFVGGAATRDLVDHKNSAHASQEVSVPVAKVKEPLMNNRLIGPNLWDIYIDPLLEPIAMPITLMDKAAPLVPLLAFPDTAAKIQTVDGDRSLKVIAQVPGMSDKDVKVEASEHMLTIKAHKMQEEKDSGRFQSFDEIFEQSVHLPCKVNADRVQASVRDGILTVTLPKT
jgi:HSP20 family molecular chaperone IbpA